MSENIKTIEQAAAELKGQVTTAAKEAADTAVKVVKDSADAAMAEAQKALAAAKANDDEITKMATEYARNRGAHGGEAESIKGAFLRYVEAKDAEGKSIADKFKAFKETRKEFSFVLDEKAALDILTPGPTVGGPLPERRADIQGPLDEFDRVTTYIPGGSTTSNAHQFVRELAVIGGPGMVGEGELKPGLAITPELVTVPVRKMAVTIHMSEEVLEDMPRFVSYVQARANTLMNDLKDTQMLYGDNTGNNLQGVSPLATAFSAGTLRAANATGAHVLRAAIAHVRRLKEKCTAVFVNPDDLAQMEIDQSNGPLSQQIITFNGTGTPTIGRVPIVALDAVTAGTFIAGNFAGGVQYFDRKTRSLRIYDQNGTDAEHNMVLVVIEERGVQEVYRNKAFVKGTLAAGITALKAA